MSYRSAIRAIIGNSVPVYYENLTELQNVIEFVEGTSDIRNWVARMLLLQFGRHQHGNLRWHLENVLWSRLLPLHFSDYDIVMLWCHFAPYENGVGLNESANFMYGRDVNSLQEEELLILVAKTRSPRYYAKHPEVFQKRLRPLIQEYQQQRKDMKQ